MRSQRALAACVVAVLLLSSVVLAVVLGGRSGQGGGEGRAGSAASEASTQERAGAALGEGSTQAQDEAETSDGASLEAGGLVRTSRWRTDDDVTVAATALLEGYRDGGEPSVLVRSGYLDLLGRTWSCTVQGDGWVDTCIVSACDGGGSEVCVARMEEERWEESYADG